MAAFIQYGPTNFIQAIRVDEVRKEGGEAYGLRLVIWARPPELKRAIPVPPDWEGRVIDQLKRELPPGAIMPTTETTL